MAEAWAGAGMGRGREAGGGEVHELRLGSLRPGVCQLLPPSPACTPSSVAISAFHTA